MFFPGSLNPTHTPAWHEESYVYSTHNFEVFLYDEFTFIPICFPFLWVYDRTGTPGIIMVKKKNTSISQRGEKLPARCAWVGPTTLSLGVWCVCVVFCGSLRIFSSSRSVFLHIPTYWSYYYKVAAYILVLSCWLCLYLLLILFEWCFWWLSRQMNGG